MKNRLSLQIVSLTVLLFLSSLLAMAQENKTERLIKIETSRGDMLVRLYREECPCIEQETRMFLRDCYDHTVQIMDLLESYREMAATMLEVYLSSVSNRLNESMRLLTIIATVFIPLTFIAGVYGMNFGNNTQSEWAMPELRWEYGYPAVWLLMVVIAGLMFYLFKRNRWM